MKEERLNSIEEMGEFGLIEHLTKDTENTQKSTIKGVGDDAAVIGTGEHFQVVTTDMLVEGIHFDLMYTPLKHLGYKAIVVNVSDIYAMNAVPRQVTVSIAISGKFSVEALEQFYEGVNLACKQYNVDLVGGDTSSSITGMTISVMAMGTAAKNEVVYRSGAKLNNLICVQETWEQRTWGYRFLNARRNYLRRIRVFSRSWKIMNILWVGFCVRMFL